MRRGRGSRRQRWRSACLTIGAVLIVAIGASCATALAGGDGDDNASIERILDRLSSPVLEASEAASMLPRFVNENLPEPQPPDSYEVWCRELPALRQKVREHLGIDDLLPAGWPLNLQHRGTLLRDGYRIEKLTYESYPGQAVPALLYLPEPSPGNSTPRRMPAIVSIAGHVYGAGKSAEFLQIRNVNLVRRGCVVLAYDYIDCGERNTGPDARNGQPYGGGNDHGIKLFSYTRRNPTGLEVLDGIRAIDLLVQRDDVDPERIGFTGESGGGNSTYWVAAIDPRVRLAVPVSCLTTFDYWIRMNRNWDWHQRPWGIRRHTDIGGLMAMHAPRPLVAISSLRGSDDEEFPWTEAEKSAAYSRRVYELADSGAAFVHLESTTGHGYQRDKREILYEAVEKWLDPPSPLGREERGVDIESFDDLQCLDGRPNLTHFEIYQGWLRDLPGRLPDDTDDWERAARRFLAERLGESAGPEGAIPDAPRPMRVEQVRRETHGKWTMTWLRCTLEEPLVLPALRITSADARQDLVVIPGRDPARVARALRDRCDVLTFDPRGTGELRGGEGMLRNWSWFFGRPLVAQQARDLRGMIAQARQERPGAKVRVSASETFALPALLAAASQFDADLELDSPLGYDSFRDLIQRYGDRALADLPGLFQFLDVRDLQRFARSRGG